MDGYYEVLDYLEDSTDMFSQPLDPVTQPDLDEDAEYIEPESSPPDISVEDNSIYMPQSTSPYPSDNSTPDGDGSVTTGNINMPICEVGMC